MVSPATFHMLSSHMSPVAAISDPRTYRLCPSPQRDMGQPCFRLWSSPKRKQDKTPWARRGFCSQILALHDPQCNASQYNTVVPAGFISILCFAITWVYLHNSFHYLFIRPILSAKSAASPLSNSSQGVVLSLIRQCQPTNALNSVVKAARA